MSHPHHPELHHADSRGDRPDRLICYCLGISEMEVRGSLSTGAVEGLKDVMDCTGAGTGCTACHRRILGLLEQHRTGEAARPAYSPSPSCIAR